MYVIEFYLPFLHIGGCVEQKLKVTEKTVFCIIRQCASWLDIFSFWTDNGGFLKMPSKVRRKPTLSTQDKNDW